MIWTIIFNPYIDILLIISFVSVIYFIYSKTKILTRNKIYEKDIYNDIL